MNFYSTICYIQVLDFHAAFELYLNQNELYFRIYYAAKTCYYANSLWNLNHYNKNKIKI